jgi:hypothetical protein
MTPVLRLLNRPLAALEAWFGRRTAVLGRPGAAAWASLIVPVLLGLMSVWMGQDSNWDLQNYHWYNPHALLNGRLDVDMAPGQFQSYFNPAIDLPYYLMTRSLPGPLVGFLMGFVHGLNFMLVAAIAHRVLGARGIDHGLRLPLLLAGAGVCGVGFLSELGNTMGDNLTSLLVLSSLLLLLRGWQGLERFSSRTLGLVLLAGALMGVGAGLKLTNAVYALALCLALLTVPLPFARRLMLAVLYGCGVLVGLLASAGWWWLTLWKRFGNPLFPQFNQVFRSPLAAPVGVIDNFHLPHNAVEALFWPFVFFRDFKRIGEIALRPAIMPVLYAAAIVFAFVWLRERIAGARRPTSATTSAPQSFAFSPQARTLLVFGLLAYLAWMKMFSIYRYLVPFELLAPLMLWLLVERVAARADATVAARIGGWLLALATLIALPVMTWGHAGWGKTGFAAAFPPLAQPASTIVFTAHGDPPMGWLATFVPRDVRVIGLGLGVEESPAYVDRIKAAIASRPGPHYVMLASARNDKQAGVQRKQALADALGMTADTGQCARLDRLLHRVRFQVQVKFAPLDGRACTLELQPQYRVDLDAGDHAILQAAQGNMAPFGLQITEAGCRRYPASIGAEAFPFRLCPVTARR